MTTDEEYRIWLDRSFSPVWYGHQYEMDTESVDFYAAWHAWPITVLYSGKEKDVTRQAIEIEKLKRGLAD